MLEAMNKIIRIEALMPPMLKLKDAKILPMMLKAEPITPISFACLRFIFSISPSYLIIKLYHLCR